MSGGEPLAAGLALAVENVLRRSGLKQYAVADQLGITHKHLSQLLRGHIRMTVDVADRILRVCGYRLPPLEPVPLTDSVPGGERPQYQLIVDDVCQRIHSGELRPGGRLESYTRLAERYGVTVNVARAAVVELRRLGVAATKHGIGTLVTGVPPEPVEDRVAALEATVRRLEATVAGVEELARTPLVQVGPVPPPAGPRATPEIRVVDPIEIGEFPGRGMRQR